MGQSGRDWFWEHAAACGLLATRLTEAAGRPRAECDTAFTIGLLHDLGRVLYIEHLPEHYPQVIQTAERLQLPLETVESRLLMLNHAEITERLLRAWKFPDSLIGPVAYHHETLAGLKRKVPNGVGEVLPLVLANRLSHALLMGSSGNDVLYPIDEIATNLGIATEVLERLCRSSGQDLADLRTTMLMHAGEPGQPHIDLVRERLGDLRPLVLSRKPSSDPVALMFGALSGGGKYDNPNVIVLTVSVPMSRGQADARVEEASEELNRWSDSEIRLPVLVVADSTACLLSGDALHKHRVRQVMLPISMNRLLAHLQRLVDGGVPRAEATPQRP